MARGVGGEGGAVGGRDPNAGSSGGAQRGGNGGKKNRAGMPSTLLDSRYPGASSSTVRTYDATLENLAKVGAIAGSIAGGLPGTVVGGLKTGLDAVTGDGLSMKDFTDPFSGRGPDVGSTGAGFADSGAQGREGSSPTTPLLPATAPKPPKPKPSPTKPTQPLSPGYTLLKGAGGTLLGT